MIKVSAIVPVYNGEKYLNKCLDSLISQTLKDIEIIIINDGSTDNSEKILKEYQSKDKRIKYFNQKNGGQASARNNGLKHAQGEYISFIDSDDYIDSKMYEDLYNNAQNLNTDITICSYYLTYPDEKYKYDQDIFEDKDNINLKEYLLFTPSPWNKIYRRSFLVDNKFKFPEGIIYEDYCSIPTLAKYNPRISYVDYPYVYYIQNPKSTTRGDEYKEKYKDILTATDHLYKEMINTNYKKELEYLIIYHLLYLGSLNFYKYNKFELIDQISNFMKANFPKWNKNKYLNKFSKKDILLMYLFYQKKYFIIKSLQKLKKSGENK